LYLKPVSLLPDRGPSGLPGGCRRRTNHPVSDPGGVWPHARWRARCIAPGRSFPQDPRPPWSG